MGKHSIVLRNQLYDVAGRPWEGDNTSLKAQLITTMKQWPILGSTTGEQPPLSYSEEEIAECLDRDSKQKTIDDQMQELRDAIGIHIDGLTAVDEFGLAQERAALIKAELVRAAESEGERDKVEKQWPFQDHEEID